jgi:hypothetical protein
MPAASMLPPNLSRPMGMLRPMMCSHALGRCLLAHSALSAATQGTPHDSGSRKFSCTRAGSRCARTCDPAQHAQGEAQHACKHQLFVSSASLSATSLEAQGAGVDDNENPWLPGPSSRSGAYPVLIVW